jgi:hypothetical protein
MNKGKKDMKKNKETKLNVKGPEAIEDGLMDMGRDIEAGGPWTHPEMERIPEWRGADIRITSDFKTDLVPLHRPRPIRSSRPAEGMRYAPEFNEANYFDHDLTVRTRHAGPATWFVFQMRDLFDGWLDYGNKYGFYELLSQAALEHLAANQPEPEDARPLLRAMLTRAFLMLEVAKEHHVWPDDAMMVLHSQDHEGKQLRESLEGPGFE